MITSRYRCLLAEADAWFSRAAEVHRDEVQCRKGCDPCCRGLFDATPLDALLVAEGYREASPEVRRRLLRAAREGLAAIAAAAPDWGPPWRIGQIGSERFDALCDALDRLPCPALDDDGGCLVYAPRPLVCRVHGVPMYDPGAAAPCGGECPLNMAAERLPERPALHFDHAGFEARELALMAEAVDGPGAPPPADPDALGTVVAAAILAAARETGDL
jgi:Fe-S-cluster containining protein